MKKIFKNGISIRAIHIAMLVCAAAIVGLLIYSVTQSSGVFSTFSAETENYIVRQKAAHDLMEASDYLTENVQRFTLNGDVRYMNQYFEEADSSKRREAAVNAMAENHADQSLIDQLNAALDGSVDLMEKEKHAMKLVIEAKKEVIEDPERYKHLDLIFEENEAGRYPDVIESFDLKDISDRDNGKSGENEELLSPDEKMELAQKLVMDSEYYADKEAIRVKLKSALEMMDDQMAATRRKTSADMMKDLTFNRVLIIVLVVVLGILILLTVTLSTIPLITAYRCKKRNERIPVIGSKEFRAMAESYNDMYERLQPPPENEE